MKSATNKLTASCGNSITNQETSSSNKRKKTGASKFFQIFKRSKKTSNDNREKLGFLQTIQKIFRRKPKKKSPESKFELHSKISKDTSTNLNAVSDEKTNKNPIKRKSCKVLNNFKDKDFQALNTKNRNQITRRKSENEKIHYMNSEKNQIADKHLSVPSTNENQFLEFRIKNQVDPINRLSHSLPNKARVRKTQHSEASKKPWFNSRNVNVKSSVPIDNSIESNRYDGRDVRSLNTTTKELTKKAASKKTNIQSAEDFIVDKTAGKKQIKDDKLIKLKLFIDWPTNNYIEMYMCGKGNDENSPIGFENPIGYCYLNSVLQVIVSCKDFVNDFEAYDKWNSCENDSETLFVKALFNLIRALKRRNHQQVVATLKTVQFYINESAFGDDVYKCFMNLLTRVSRVIKCEPRNTEQPKLSMPVTRQGKADVNFKRLENRNHGFVFNNFYGQITFQTICKICNNICNESFQMIKSLPLPVPKTERPVSLDYCVNLFLNESDVEVDSPMKCDCPGGTFNLKYVTRITHAPKYLLAYLNRGSYNEDGEKIETTVKCKHTIEIETTTGFKKYKLISVIDHIGNSSYGHYYCKCNYETYNWYLLNDTHVELISKKEVVTKQAIVFLFKQI